jgi:TAT (twin-arginine translocation) pathway signal sequence
MSIPDIRMELSRRSLLRGTAGLGAGALATSLFGKRASREDASLGEWRLMLRL